MSFLDRFRRKKAEDEDGRRSRLLLSGRITDGNILDVTCDDSGAVTGVVFTYFVSGVEYESSQSLNHEQRRRMQDYAPGAGITVRYDPRRPGNSVVV
jgi:uncharacterized protein DUF3592